MLLTADYIVLCLRLDNWCAVIDAVNLRMFLASLAYKEQFYIWFLGGISCGWFDKMFFSETLWSASSDNSAVKGLKDSPMKLRCTNCNIVHKQKLTSEIIQFSTFLFLSPPNSKCLQRLIGNCFFLWHTEHSILNTIFFVVLA